MRYDVMETPTILPPGEKWCPGCVKSHEFAEFYTDRNGNLSVYCKTFNSERGKKAYRQRGGASVRRERLRINNLKRLFKLSPEQYTAMWSAQGGVCAACGKAETAIDYRTKCPKKLAVDHCHTTGKIRGLLCSSCNLALGLLQDDIERLRALEQYILLHE